MAVHAARIDMFLHIRHADILTRGLGNGGLPDHLHKQPICDHPACHQWGFPRFPIRPHYDSFFSLYLICNLTNQTCCIAIHRLIRSERDEFNHSFISACSDWMDAVGHTAQHVECNTAKHHRAIHPDVGMCDTARPIRMHHYMTACIVGLKW